MLFIFAERDLFKFEMIPNVAKQLATVLHGQLHGLFNFDHASVYHVHEYAQAQRESARPGVQLKFRSLQDASTFRLCLERMRGKDPLR